MRDPADPVCKGEPISMVSGEELLTLEDFALPGPVPFVWKRIYRTSHCRDIGLGHGWVHPGVAMLTLKTDTVELMADDGRRISFKRPPMGRKSQQRHEGMTLIYESTTCFILTQAGQPNKVFERLSDTTSGITGNWHFDEGTGNTVTDSVNSTTATLTWSSFTGPDPAVPAVYTLQRLAADGSVLSTLAVTGTNYTDLTPPTDRQVLRYRLQIGGAGLPVGTFSFSNLAGVTRQPTLAIPTAFTPNGDGLNDVLEVKGKYLNNYTFVVVDRNGQEVFRGTQRGETWDGTIKGHAPVLGAYVWRFQQKEEDGKPFSATGAVTILK